MSGAVCCYERVTEQNGISLLNVLKGRQPGSSSSSGFSPLISQHLVLVESRGDCSDGCALVFLLVGQALQKAREIKVVPEAFLNNPARLISWHVDRFSYCGMIKSSLEVYGRHRLT